MVSKEVVDTVVSFIDEWGHRKKVKSYQEEGEVGKVWYLQAFLGLHQVCIAMTSDGQAFTESSTSLGMFHVVVCSHGWEVKKLNRSSKIYS